MQLTKKQRKQNKPLRYKSGDLIAVWGKEYKISFRDSRTKNSLTLDGDKAILRMKKESTPEQREAFVTEWYRTLLQQETDKRLPIIEAKTGLSCSTYGTKKMSTLWGSCNTTTKKIWLNVELVQKPVECLEYVILHELAHCKVPKHSLEFKKIISDHMPDWYKVEKSLNQ